MKTIENITVYQCEHCNKKMFRKHALLNHENNCGADPKNWRVCSSCDFMERKSIDYYYDTYDGEGTGTSKGFYCTELKTYIYPNFLENKAIFKKHPEQFDDQIPFKKECEHLTICRTHYGKDYDYDLQAGI